MTIQLDNGGESQIFEATRNIRNSDHTNGLIVAGERVFFRAHERDVAAASPITSVTMLYESGEPTNGSEYVTFDSLREAEQFATRTGLVPRE